ncbi:MAG: hypothetical protein HY553_18405 [Elusimicrobia bacterium]|nr:hypothetical protein [Elusimicrobiota bacterium]
MTDGGAVLRVRPLELDDDWEEVDLRGYLEENAVPYDSRDSRDRLVERIRAFDREE